MLKRSLLFLCFISITNISFSAEEAKKKKPRKKQKTEQAEKTPIGYNPMRTKGMYSAEEKTFQISRTKLQLFKECPWCFYTDRVLGLKMISSPPFTLNCAVDETLKLSFNQHREAGTVHPYCEANNINAIPFQHPDLSKWQDQLHGGLKYQPPGKNIVLQGAPDDIWVEDGKLVIVDYKATSKKRKEDDGPLTVQDLFTGYPQQIAFYAYLLKKMALKGPNGEELEVADKGYFVHCNARKDEPFNGQLDFDVSIIPSEHDYSWIEPQIESLSACLQQSTIPEPSEECKTCAYRRAAEMLMAASHQAAVNNANQTIHETVEAEV